MASPESVAAPAYDAVSLTFQESMAGRLQPTGRPQSELASFEVDVQISSLGAFLSDPNHAARLSGTVTYPPLGTRLRIEGGRFHLFSPDGASGMRQIVYRLPFRTHDDMHYCLCGHKDIQDDPDRIDLVEDMTRLHATLHQGSDETGPMIAAGELRFLLQDAPALIASMHLEGAQNLAEEVGARIAFASFLWGALREEYFKPFRLLYDTSYENLVFTGRLAGTGEEFFFVSGVHDRGFPWGDSEMFSDLLLVMGSGAGRRLYAITDRVLAGLELDVRRGRYRYKGPLYRLTSCTSTSFSAIERHDSSLEKVDAEIEFDFESQEFDTVPYPFPLVPEAVRKLSSNLQASLRGLLPSEHALGIQITPHRARLRAGSIALAGSPAAAEPATVFGECERGTFRNLKEPTLLYHYLCALSPGRGMARIQIAARTLRNDRTDWVKDQIDRYLGAVVNRWTSSEMRISPAGLAVVPVSPTVPDAAEPLKKSGSPVLEVNNDHFPTAVFQRRIVEVCDGAGEKMLALEEDMSLMRLEPVKCARKAKVASCRGELKLASLGEALDRSGFDTAVREAHVRSGKPREQFLVVIKPNFMFAYDKRDVSTYTDPELVGALVSRIRGLGFPTVKVVEAQSTYGEFFDHRSVGDMADYLGFTGYDVVDMTEDIDEYRDLSPALGRHPVSKTWRDADYRISFGKNKTHAYAFYSLCLKNIYGALPLANKFKEYHCGRDIYQTTIDYLRLFPVHFGIVDAWLSADGPFGVFADTGPNQTRTIIAGADIVAVDWVAATKMGIDPMVSKYMQLAVDVFGKPEIELVGDRGLYWPWLNVPAILPELAHKGMDAEYNFGNLLYSIAAHMDPARFQYRDKSIHVRLLRAITGPLRETFFLQTGRAATPLNKFFARLFYKLGS